VRARDVSVRSHRVAGDHAEAGHCPDPAKIPDPSASAGEWHGWGYDHRALRWFRLCQADDIGTCSKRLGERKGAGVGSRTATCA
jgi:hypothetical protein